MGFFDRNRKEVARRGYDVARLPPGQYFTDRFPVLHVGDIPDYEPGQWDLSISGLVDSPFTIGFDELRAMPSITMTVDIHCVTKWTKFDMAWTGVPVRDLFERAGVQTEAEFVVEHAEFGYTTNLPMADITTPRSIVAFAYDGHPIEPEHGGPVRIVVPHLYFWKSAKWVRSLELLAHDRPGFWERNGYHGYGDPFKEQRHSF